MRSNSKINAYCQTVNEQVRWNKAHRNISVELENHIEDQKEVYILGGMGESDAIETSVAEMGDPVSVGMALDRIHRPNTQVSMFIVTITLVIIGFLVRYFVSSDIEEPLFVGKQIFTMIVGLALMLLLYYIDFSIIGKYPLQLYGISVSLSLLMIIFANNYSGRAFLHLGTLAISAGHLALIYPIIIAALIYRMHNNRYSGIIISWFGILIFGGILLNVPMLFGFVHFIVISILLMCIAVYKKWFGVSRLKGLVALVLPMVVSAFVFLAWTLNNVNTLQRLGTMVLAGRNPEGVDFRSMMSRILINNAEWIGHGKNINIDMEQSFNLLDIWTDDIVAYGIYAFGWVPFVIVACIIFAFIVKGFRRCFKQKSVLGLLVSTAIMSSMSAQVFGYVMFNFGFRLISPLSLPFISYGNTALMINLAFTGIMLSVFRNGDETKDNKMFSKKAKAAVLEE